MKIYTYRIFLIIILITTSDEVKCQIEKNYWIISGTINASKFNEKVINNFGEHYIMPILKGELNINNGYFFLNKAALGIKSTLIHKRGKANLNPGTTIYRYYTELYIGPFARYYIMKNYKNYNFLVDGSFQFGNSIYRSGKTMNKELTVTGGPVFFAKNSIAIEAIIGYRYNFRSNPDSSAGVYRKINGIIFNVNLSYHLSK